MQRDRKTMQTRMPGRLPRIGRSEPLPFRNLVRAVNASPCDAKGLRFYADAQPRRETSAPRTWSGKRQDDVHTKYGLDDRALKLRFDSDANKYPTFRLRCGATTSSVLARSLATSERSSTTSVPVVNAFVSALYSSAVAWRQIERALGSQFDLPKRGEPGGCRLQLSSQSAKCGCPGFS